MESMRENWTDKRLDDLNHKVDAGFERGDADIRGLRVEMRTEFGALRGEMKSGFDRTDERFDRTDARFDRIDERFDRIDERFERMNGRFEALHRLLVQSAVVLLAALVGLHFV
jgi:tetrahydromethanopterin S-methyltransferase subunit G